MTDTWEKAGVIGVDAGLCWIGDPCYVLHREEQREQPDIGKDWGEFCDRLRERESKNAAQWNYSPGHAGLGVTVGTGYGDGSYPVYVRRNAEGRVMAVMVDFEGTGDDEEGEDE